jgi:catechol 2,3-dioxygenase-like lactoylglutathione lyase family enzyme
MFASAHDRPSLSMRSFHTAALAAGGSSDGEPGYRPSHGNGYYAAFIRDPDGNRIEAVTFVGAK